MNAIDRADLTGPSYQQNHHRVAHQEEIEQAISAWTSQRTADEVIEAMNEAGVPVGRVVSVEEVVKNEQNLARDAVREVPVKDWTVKMQGTFPVLDGVNSQPVSAGPDLGYHTDEVLTEELNMTKEEIHQLRKDGIIG
jgi:crotonobetainyl-CoA:carnitine CoA-transferase CaiB-like acyl-CoA transferase